MSRLDRKLTSTEVIQGLSGAVLLLHPEQDSYYSGGNELRLKREDGVPVGIEIYFRDGEKIFDMTRDTTTFQETYLYPNKFEALAERRERVIRKLLTKMMSVIPLEDYANELVDFPPAYIEIV